MNYVTKTFLLVSSSVSSIQQLCFVQVQGQKREQKHTAKNFVEFYNNPLLLTMPRLRLSELTLVKLLDLKLAVSLGYSTFKGEDEMRTKVTSGTYCHAFHSRKVTIEQNIQAILNIGVYTSIDRD